MRFCLSKYRKSLKYIFAITLFFSAYIGSFSQSNAGLYISFQNGKGYFPLAVSGKPAPLYSGVDEFPGVIRALKNLQTDLKRVTANEPAFFQGENRTSKEMILVGTLGKNRAIDELVKTKKIDVANLKGRWETYQIQVVEKPFPGVSQALVIVGSDKRGTIFGIYDVSAQIGVSPWYWWADVPVKPKKNLYIIPGVYSAGEPKVKYRGIFINDEAPALSGWTHEKNGGFNHKLYENVFELILRLKGNFLWPAMWGNAFYDDDTLNPKLADEYGVVIGTSHHEPLMRAHSEWKKYGSGKWNYQTNETVLKEFWKKSIERMGSNESLVTVGMRGDGDEPMTEGTQISLLEKIVADQRQIIKDVTGKNPAEIHQVWALYKEVQEYYDKGMRVPDDVTLLLCDDNWGNIRKLPKLDEKPRTGGYGVYYHFDYVGDPRNYKWLNTNTIARVWEQMNLAYQYKANQLWIVNVGDIKPMEFPISFFLDCAWNPEKIQAHQLKTYTENWSKQQFGNQYASSIADILNKYTKYNGRRKPELISPETYSLLNYREAESIVADYHQLSEEAEKIYQQLPAEYKDAYFELVLHPVKACANLNELFLTVAKNRLYAKQGRSSTNEMAEKAQAFFEKDAEISRFYNQSVAGGKWNHMMDQTHISYTYWQQPEKDVLPEVKKIELPSNAEMGISVEGSEAFWVKETNEATLPSFNNISRESHFFEIFNRGNTSFDYNIEIKTPWLTLSSLKGKIEKEQRIWVNVNWKLVPAGKHEVPVTVNANGNQIRVKVVIDNSIPLNSVKGFVESDGYISIEAAHFTKSVETKEVKWQIIPDLGRTLSGITSVPVTSPSQNISENSPHLEYSVYISDTGNVDVKVYLSPTLNFTNQQGFRYGISFDNEPVQVVNMHADNSKKTWEKSVADNIKILISKHLIKKPGVHVLKFSMIDPGIILQKIVIDCGGLKPSYLGPPESRFFK